MQNLLLQEGDVITLRSATLPKGTFVKLQPHSKDFLDISNPRAVLETTLRNFSCLTVGDTIPIHYNNKSYFIDIIEAKPEAAISVIETDCNVDFAPPLDYVEPDWAAEAAAAALAAAAASAGNTSSAVPMATEATTSGQGGGGGGEGAAAAADQGPTFLAFAGSGRRLDGKPASESRPVAIPVAGLRQGGGGTATGGTDSGPGSASGSAPKNGSAPGRKKAGKLMFKDRLAAKYGDGAQPGGGGGGVPKPKPADPPAEEKKEPESSFKAFQGAANKLK